MTKDTIDPTWANTSPNNGYYIYVYYYCYSKENDKISGEL
jgi:hypothetical protein